MIVWPEPLIRELAARRCLLFLGAGASAGCLAADGVTKPPTWSSFLECLRGKLASPSEKNAAEQLIAEKKYLEAAEIIFANLNAAEITQFVRDVLVAPRFQPSAVHKAVLDIDPKVVVTTNYDDVYDTYCRSGDAQAGYNVCKYYESHIVSDLRSPVRLIVKAHGCVSDCSKIVLTRSQYFRQRRDYASFYRVLDALFITGSILFIGYSLSDPDIQLVLENANIAAPDAHPHYAVIGNDAHPALKESWSRAYNITFLEYESGNFTELNDSLCELAQFVDAFRLANEA